MALTSKQEGILSKLIESMVQDMPEELAAALLLIGVTLTDVEKELKAQQEQLSQLDLAKIVATLTDCANSMAAMLAKHKPTEPKQKDTELASTMARIEDAMKKLSAKPVPVIQSVPTRTTPIEFDVNVRRGSDGFFEKFTITEKR